MKEVIFWVSLPFVAIEIGSLIVMLMILTWGLHSAVLRWRNILSLVFNGIAFTTIAQGIVFGIVWMADKTALTYPVYSWGLRVIALLGLWRTVLPNKDWNNEDGSTPRYARMKLLGLALLAGALSFMPIA
jgi:hypothetical protein